MEDEEEFFSFFSPHFSVSAYSVKQQRFQLFVRQRDFYFMLFDLFSGAVFYWPSVAVVDVSYQTSLQSLIGQILGTHSSSQHAILHLLFLSLSRLSAAGH